MRFILVLDGLESIPPFLEYEVSGPYTVINIEDEFSAEDAIELNEWLIENNTAYIYAYYRRRDSYAIEIIRHSDLNVDKYFNVEGEMSYV